MYQLELGRRMLMPSARLVGVGMDYRHPIDHMRVGKQRDTAYIRKKQYRQKIFRYVVEQPFHDCRFTDGDKDTTFRPVLQ